jgi:hypothetical protein
MPQNLNPKKMTIKRGDLRVRIRGDLTTILWRDKRDVHILTSIHGAPAEGNFCYNSGKAIKPQIVADYNRHMAYVDKGEKMAKTKKISRRDYRFLLTKDILEMMAQVRLEQHSTKFGQSRFVTITQLKCHM